MFHLNLVSLEYMWSETGNHTSVVRGKISGGGGWGANIEIHQKSSPLCKFAVIIVMADVDIFYPPKGGLLLSLLPAASSAVQLGASDSMVPRFHSTPDTPTFSATHLF